MTRNAALRVSEKATLPRYVELVRVSSRGQADRDTPDVQRRALEKLRESRPGTLVKRIDPDDGISGALPLAQRTDLQELVALSKQGAFDELRVYAVDRLTRSEDPRERMAIFGMLQEAGAVLVDTTGKVIDPGDESGMGELDYYLQTFFAAKERKRILRRTFDGKRRGAAKGNPSHGSVPYGLGWKRQTEKWFVVEDEAAIVKQIFRRAADGASLGMIADALNANGIPSPTRRRWCESQIAKMLKNRTYVGKYELKIEGEKYVCTVPSLVTPEVWDRVQEGLEHRRSRATFATEKVEALIRWRGICGECGGPLHVTQAKSGDNIYRYYVCATKAKPKRYTAQCANRSHPIELVDSAAWDGIAAQLRNPGLLASAAHSDAEKAVQPWESEIVVCERRLEQIKKDEAWVIGQRRAQRLSDETASEELEKLTRERRSLTQRLETARVGMARRDDAAKEITSLSEKIGVIRRNLDTADFTTRRQLIEAIVPALPGFGVTVHRDGRLEIRGALNFGGADGGGDFAPASKSSRACVAGAGGCSRSSRTSG